MQAIGTVRHGIRVARATGQQLLSSVPLARRTVNDLLRIEVFDRTTVIAAQALLALVPLVVVLAAFLPEQLTRLGLEQFQSVTGVGPATVHAGLAQAGESSGGLDTGQVRAQTGWIGLLVTLLSASSFARAVQRMYERVWQRRHVGGAPGWVRSVRWLVGWLVLLQLLPVVEWAVDALALSGLAPVSTLARWLLSSAVWWWSAHLLLSGRVPWRRLVWSALLTGLGLVVYSAGSGLVMPRYARSSAEQFGIFGLVLAVATWLVGFAGVLVVAAVLGRVLAEDTWVSSMEARVAGVVRRLRSRRSA